MDAELLSAKCTLYGALLKKGAANWTNTEVNIAYELSHDKQIQDYLRAHFEAQYSGTPTNQPS